MAIHWKLIFKPLRQSSTTYTVNIYDAAYSGAAIPLIPGAQPFVTEEDSDEDQFAPVRTQSGYLRIVDNGQDANGNAFNWQSILPSTDTDRPVTLTDQNGTILWMGFMQAQNFGGELYGNPQEREFPIQCCLSVLNAKQVSTTESALHNFAYLLYTCLVTNMPGTSFASFVIQGGADARNWLLKKFDWNNFLTETEESDAEARYTYYGVLEDMCRFWGWTIRTHRNVVYLTAMDDSAEQTILTLTPTQLNQLATESSTSAGTVSNVAAATTLSGDIFASTNNDTYMNRGPHKATVKSEVNEADRVVSVLPVSIEKQLDATGWTWHQGEEDLVGYFETSQISSFDSPRLSGSNYSNYCKFSRRQIYSTKETDSTQTSDMMVFKNLTGSSFPYISLQTKKAMAFAGGTLNITGTIYTGDRVTTWTEATAVKMRIGIGMSRATARWFFIEPLGAVQINSGWSTPGTVKDFYAGVVGGSLKGIAFQANLLFTGVRYYPLIPVANEANLYGYLFIDFGDFTSNGEAAESFEIADFTVRFSRDSYVLPSYISQVRGREVKEERISQKEYSSENQNSTGVEWNADCIFASDNNMKYGYGLLMNSDGTFMEKAPYGATLTSPTTEHPEQHLANRVTAYWNNSRRRLGVELRTDAIAEPTPVKKLTMDGTTFYPIAISHDWRDDVTILTMLQL